MTKKQLEKILCNFWDWTHKAAIPPPKDFELIGRIIEDNSNLLEPLVMQKRRHVKQTWFNANSIEYETPDEIFEPLASEFGITLDVAATNKNAKCKKYFTAEDDGLIQEWSGVCWMNPPFGKVMKKWVIKAYEEYQKGNTIICLLPARTNTNWWHDYVIPNAEVRFIRGEVKFKGFERGLWMPMAIVIFKPFSA